MSELANIQKAIEDSQTEIKQIFDAQRGEIEKTGKANKELTEAQAKIGEELKALGARMFDIEQKGAGGGDLSVKKSMSETVATETVEAFKQKSSRHAVEVGSFYKAVTTAEDSSGALSTPMRLPGIISDPDQPLRVRDLMAQGRTSQTTIEFVREDVFTNSAKVVKEGAQKPESNITFSKADVSTKVIAHWIQLTKQAASDAPMLQSYIGGRLLYGLGLVEDEQFLNGDGTGDNLVGINTVATAYDTTLDAKGDTAVDKLAHAIFQVTESEYYATGIVLNPRDWHTLALMKDGEGRYILGGPQAIVSRTLWGLPVVTTPRQAQDTFSVGAFSLASQVWDQWSASITTSDQDRDNFVKNMLTILAEERLAIAHYRPKALVKGTFSAATGG